MSTSIDKKKLTDNNNALTIRAQHLADKLSLTELKLSHLNEENRTLMQRNLFLESEISKRTKHEHDAELRNKQLGLLIDIMHSNLKKV